MSYVKFQSYYYEWKIVKFVKIISKFKISTLEAQRSQTRIMFMVLHNLVNFLLKEPNNKTLIIFSLIYMNVYK
jgi:hypothetical protein